VINEQPVLLNIIGQGTQIFSTFTAYFTEAGDALFPLDTASTYNTTYTLPSGTADNSYCGWYTLSNFLLVKGGLEATYYTNRWFSGDPYM
jgi:hypothetical protein